MSNQDSVLMAVLDCGTADLGVLDDIAYDVGDIAESLMDEGIRPSLNAIMEEVFQRAAEELDHLLTDRICELEAVKNGRELDADEKKELDVLRKLNPERDIEWYCNCLDTHVWFNEHGDEYREYLSDALETVEDHMGFSFSC